MSVFRGNISAYTWWTKKVWRHKMIMVCPLFFHILDLFPILSQFLEVKGNYKCAKWLISEFDAESKKNYKISDNILKNWCWCCDALTDDA